MVGLEAACAVGAQTDTVLSTLEQADSISQVTVGPGMGVIGRLAGIRAAFVASAALLAPSALAVRVAGRGRRNVLRSRPAAAETEGLLEGSGR